ncbi:AraC family transcriptional regulator [Actinoplanes sp. OR16]|uniref:AraC family transcriptional regulator n=1 Tax=Actinoplanes sp. OR16 TaxID=946334 RepID=UPI000FD885BB|nr:AraC family transcriptional regulator [Actinoplanes sp. OR16]
MGEPAISVRTGDLDEAREVCGEHMYPRSMRLLERGARLDAHYAFLKLDAMTIGDVRYGTPVAISVGELGGYHVNLAASGHFFAGQGRRPLEGGPRQAAVYRPVGHTELHYTSADCRLFAVKIDRWAMEACLRDVHDVPVRGPIRFAGRLDVSRPPGRSCAALIRLLGEEVGNPDSIFHRPLVAAPLEEALMTALLLAVDHQYADQLHDPSRVRSTPRGITAAVDAIHDDPRRAYTVAKLAEIAGVTASQLRAGFLSRHGLTPMAYLRQIRLLAAHAELRAADPAHHSLDEIARRWSFPRQDLFAAQYRARFHEDPATTLRRQ